MLCQHLSKGTLQTWIAQHFLPLVFPLIKLHFSGFLDVHSTLQWFLHYGKLWHRYLKWTIEIMSFPDQTWWFSIIIYVSLPKGTWFIIIRTYPIVHPLFMRIFHRWLVVYPFYQVGCSPHRSHGHTITVTIAWNGVAKESSGGDGWSCTWPPDVFGPENLYM